MNGELKKCRHGVTHCYRCGVGQNIIDKKIANMLELDQRYENLPVNSPRPSLLRTIKENANPSTKTKKRRLLPCIHRGEYVGTLDCACDGARDIYRCTKIDRPEHPCEKAFCMQVLTSKPYSRIVDARTKMVLHRVNDGEVIVCKYPYTESMNGSEDRLGCSMYSPTKSLIAGRTNRRES